MRSRAGSIAGRRRAGERRRRHPELCRLKGELLEDRRLLSLSSFGFKNVPDEILNDGKPVQLPRAAALYTADLPHGVTRADLALQLAPVTSGSGKVPYSSPAGPPPGPVRLSGFTSLTSLGDAEPNDSAADARPVALGFDGGEDPEVDISGSLDGQVGGSTIVQTEDDGAIDLANASGLNQDERGIASGTIGDGPFGATSGDYDHFSVAARAGDVVTIDVNAADLGSSLDSYVGIYDSAGNLLASNDDEGGSFDSFLQFTVHADDTYSVVVRGFLSGFQADPFDSSSGGGVGSTGFYELILELSRPVEIIPTEDDGAIGLATGTGLAAGGTISASATIGDGPIFGAASGDYDHYRVDAKAGDIITVDVDAGSSGTALDSVVGIYDSAGKLLAANDDYAGSFDSFLRFTARVDDSYSVVVFGFGSGFQADPFDSSSGGGIGSTGNYEVFISLKEGDLDFFALNLLPGDILGANVSGGGHHLTLRDPGGGELVGSGRDASFIYPTSSALPGGGNSALAWVVDAAGTYAIGVDSGSGPYELNLRLFRPELEAQSISNHQVLYLDFDGATIDTAIFGSSGVVTLSPLSAFLSGWGLGAADESAVIDSIVETVEQVFADVGLSGNNGNFDSDGVPGHFGIEIRNSRDHADPFGQANVSRVIVGGTSNEMQLNVIGIAEDIDPGNFATEDSAIVLLDALSGPASGPDSLNQYPLGAGVSIIDLVGVGVGNFVAHEAGHYFGAFHTSGLNAVVNIMDDSASDRVGVGPNGTFENGGGDDVDVRFGRDLFSPFEGFTGSEDTRNVIAFGLSTGTVPAGNGMQVSDADLVAYWNFNEAGGAIAADTSPFGRDNSGTLAGQAAFTAEGLNGAVAFDGFAGNVDVPDSPDLNLVIQTTYSVSIWFNVADAAINTKKQVIWEQGGAARGLNIYAFDGKVYVGGWNTAASESNWQGSFHSTPIESNRWYHVAAVLDGGPTVQPGALAAYLDGFKFGDGDGSQIWPHGDDIGIGRIDGQTRFHDGVSSRGPGFAGLIDEARVYRRALSGTEVGMLSRDLLLLDLSMPRTDISENGEVVTATLTRNGAARGKLTVTLTSSDETAATAPGSIFFRMGERSVTFDITAVDDGVIDGTQTTTITASAASYLDAILDINVLNDDVLAISISDATALEGGTEYRFTDEFVPPDAYGLAASRNIVFGADERVYVASQDTDSVKVFEAGSGAFLGELTATAGVLDAPWAIVFGPDGRLYVSGALSDNILRFDVVTGGFDVFVPTGRSGLNEPKGLTFGADGHLYVSSTTGGGGVPGPHEVLRFQGPFGASPGASLPAPGKSGATFVSDGSGNLSNPNGLAFGPDGALYVCSTFRDEIVRYNSQTGAFIGSFIPVGSGGLDGPNHIVFRNDGLLYVGSQSTRQILRYNASNGNFQDVFVVVPTVGTASVAGFAFADSGELYVSAGTGIGRLGSSVRRYAPADRAAFTLSLGAASAVPVTVTYTTADGSAAGGSDYTAATGIVTFAPGITSMTVLLATIDDASAETTETFAVTLSNAVGGTIVDGSATGAILDNDGTKFYVVDDAGPDRTYEYDGAGNSIENYVLDAGNTAPRGAAANAAGNKVWVVDANRSVYVYDIGGSLAGSWTAGSLSVTAQVEGIATDGTDVWIVDSTTDRVFKYGNAASLTSGSRGARGSFALAAGNANPKDIVTDGVHLWVVNDSATDKVFKYTLSGSLVASWAIDPANASPTGITLDPANPAHLWIVDNATLRVYEYANAVDQAHGSARLAGASFSLAAGNTNPQGIADPPVGGGTGGGWRVARGGQEDAEIPGRGDAETRGRGEGRVAGGGWRALPLFPFGPLPLTDNRQLTTDNFARVAWRVAGGGTGTTPTRNVSEGGSTSVGQVAGREERTTSEGRRAGSAGAGSGRSETNASQAASAGASRGDLLVAVMRDLESVSGLDDHDEDDELYESLAAGVGWRDSPFGE